MGYVRALYNSKFPTLAYQSTYFAWAVYGFNSGHFPSTISKQNLLFWIILAVIPTRPTAHSFRSLYHLVLQFYQAQHLSLITFVDQATSGRLTGIWFIPIVIRRVSLPPHFGPSKHQSWHSFGWYDNWICLWHLSTPTMMANPFPSFFSQLKYSGWVLSTTKCFFPDLGDSITGTALLIVGVHDTLE